MEGYSPSGSQSSTFNNQRKQKIMNMSLMKVIVVMSIILFIQQSTVQGMQLEGKLQNLQRSRSHAHAHARSHSHQKEKESIKEQVKVQVKEKIDIDAEKPIPKPRAVQFAPPPPPFIHKRDPRQLPDIDLMTGTEMKPDHEDGISLASDMDMTSYAVAIANGGVAVVLKAIEGPDVPAEEDSGGVAQFMLDLSSKADVADDGKDSTDNAQSNSAQSNLKAASALEPKQEPPKPEDSGANFAAQFAMDLEQQQKDKDSNESNQNSNAQWFENGGKS